MKRKVNDTLIELIIGILAAGLLIQIGDFAFIKLYPNFAGTGSDFGKGFWAGVALAVGLSIHMYISIDKALDMISEDAEKYMRKAYLLRTVAILAAAGAVRYFEFGYVMATFLGVLCLKFGAFLAPLIHKLRGVFHR